MSSTKQNGIVLPPSGRPAILRLTGSSPAGGLPCLKRQRSAATEKKEMKVVSSLKSAKLRSKDCQVVRRRGKVYVICKSNPKFKARQR